MMVQQVSTYPFSCDINCEKKAGSSAKQAHPGAARWYDVTKQ